MGVATVFSTVWFFPVLLTQVEESRRLWLKCNPEQHHRLGRQLISVYKIYNTYGERSHMNTIWERTGLSVFVGWVKAAKWDKSGDGWLCICLQILTHTFGVSPIASVALPTFLVPLSDLGAQRVFLQFLFKMKERKFSHFCGELVWKLKEINYIGHCSVCIF